jgi:hypothetical protein
MALPALLALAACSGDDVGQAGTGATGGTEAGGSGTGGGSAGSGGTEAGGSGASGGSGGSVLPPNADGCNGYDLEADFTPSKMAGPGIVDGEIPPGDYIITTTYLRMKSGDAARQTFNGMVGGIITDLQARDGLVGYSLGLATGCDTARTLSVWASEEAMLEFVTGEAHYDAVRNVGEVSRGGSITVHFTGSEADATWDEAAKHFVGFSGPVY